jgi:hypothetical protein
MLGNWLQQGLYDTYPELKSKAENFVQATYVYFNNPSFMDMELGTLHRLVNETPALVARAQFRSFKALLLYQLEIYNLQM